MSSRFRHGIPQRAAAVIVGTALLIVAPGCGRSAPEGAQAPADAVEPAAAGVQVVSEQTVVPPAPTTTTAITTAPPPTTAAAAGTYIIEPGDTLSVIAERFGVSVAALSEANGITDVNTIKPGQELIIPPPG